MLAQSIVEVRVIPSERTVFCDCLLLGAAIVAAGSAAGIWLPQGIAYFLLGLAVCRICWIDDNIHHDLLQADEVPSGYLACRARRRIALGLALSRTGEEDDCPKMLASRLRVQSHAWSAFAWATLAGAVLGHPSPPALAGGALALALSLRSADYFAFGASALLSGRSLPQHLLKGRTPLARLAFSSRRSD